MSRGRQTFKESEAARLVRAVMAAGLAVRAVEVDPKSGKITVRTGDAAIGVGRIISRILLRYSLTDMKEKLPSAGERRMSEGRGFLIAFHRAGHVASRAESAN